MENNKEELRQNWHINEMHARWKSERENMKDMFKKACDIINAKRDEKIKAVKDDADAKIKEIEEAARATILAEKEKLNGMLISQAKIEDDYMHQFRLYVASLPKDEQSGFTE